MKQHKLGAAVTTSLVVLAISAYAGVSHAFPEHHEWVAPASGASGAKGQRPGADGIFYTGGAVDATLRCSACHINDKGQQGALTVNIVGTPAWQTVDGSPAYKPGVTYDFSVNLIGEHLGDGTDNNGVTVSIEDGNTEPAGVLQPDVGGRSDSDNCLAATAADPLTTSPTPAQTTVILGDCRAILSVAHGKDEKARTKWHFKWTAPAAGAGDLKVFIDAVDGDKTSSSSLNDDVVEGTVALREGK